MAKKPMGLGKGLGDLFVESPETEAIPEGAVVISAAIDRVYPDEKQHRKIFHDDSLQELADSISAVGVLQPLTVRKFGAGYRIISGERRYRASKIAGLSEIPVIVVDFDEKKAQAAALIENLQREDLNPIDEANGYATFMRDFNLTQEQAAKEIGKSRAAVANALRLLNLPASAQSLLKQGVISAGHARALIPLKDEGLIQDMLIAIVEREMSVRQVEEAVKNMLEGGAPIRKVTPAAAKNEVYQAQMKEIAGKAAANLGRKVAIRDDGTGRGKITLEYYDSKDLEEILSSLCGEEFLLNL
ncbi:MAG: ParB/RepB/Spo0J family partition protein [Ruminococcaceae bacterium]|nr:ParB/RepB/Spo0J family partition protein [Oscillospiraceae bacterium]